MKRKIMTILVALALILPFNVKAASMDSYIDWTLDRTVFAHQWRNGSDHITNLAWITANGEVAYCIEPGITADKGSYYSSSSNISDTNLRNVDTKRLSLIGYYGYGYANHNTKEYYMATQELIWRLMGVENVWWTDAKEGGNTYNIESYKNEILSLVNSYEKAPSFNFKDEYIVGDNISVNDANNILTGYEVIGNSDVNISRNSINISINDGTNTFTLRRKQNGKSPVYFYKDGYQTIGSFKYAYNYEKTYQVKGTYGKITVDKYDFDTGTKESISSLASLEGAEYTLYNSNMDIIESIKTDSTGKATFNNLSKGTYYVQELSASKGYTVDESVYTIDLNSNDISHNIASYEKIINNKIVVIKVLDDQDEGTCTPEEGIWFSVYDLNDNFVTKGVTDKKGILNLELNYGSYILRQETTFDGIDMVDDTLITVSENGVTQNLALVNHPIKKVTYKIFSTKAKKITLPKTGKKEILYILIALLISTLGLYREKESI